MVVVGLVAVVVHFTAEHKPGYVVHKLNLPIGILQRLDQFGRCADEWSNRRRSGRCPASTQNILFQCAALLDECFQCRGHEDHSHYHFALSTFLSACSVPLRPL